MRTTSKQGRKKMRCEKNKRRKKSLCSACWALCMKREKNHGRSKFADDDDAIGERTRESVLWETKEIGRQQLLPSDLIMLSYHVSNMLLVFLVSSLVCGGEGEKIIKISFREQTKNSKFNKFLLVSGSSLLTNLKFHFIINENNETQFFRQRTPNK